MREIKCPLCEKWDLEKVSTIRRRVNLIIAIVCRPVWIITLIVALCSNEYRCELCKRRFKKSLIDKQL